MQSDQSLCWSLDYSMSVKLLTEYHLEFLSFKEGCTGSSESTLVKMPHCWKSHVMAHLFLLPRFIFQINGVDLTDARHDQAVSLLTGVDKEIKLVVYREKLVSKEEAEIEPPKGEKVVNFKEPRIIWNQTIATTLPTETVTFSHVPVHEAEPEPPAPPSPVAQQPPSPQPVPAPALPESNIHVPPLPKVPPPSIPSPSPYASAIPASYTYPNQTSPPSQVLHPAPSPSMSPRTLSSDWNSPPAVIQPPKFQYPGRPQSRSSASLGDKVNRKDASPNTISDSVSSSYSATVNSSVKSNDVTSSIPTPKVISSSGESSDKKENEIHSGANTMTVERQTVTLKMPTETVTLPSKPPVSVNHVPDKYPIEECVIVKAGGPLGLSIVGGSDHSSQPFGEDEPGIFVSKVSTVFVRVHTGLKST